MIVLVCGPESSGTRLLARLVEHCAPVEHTVIHRSIPDNGDWSLPVCDRAITIVRDRAPTVASIAANHAMSGTRREAEWRWAAAVALCSTLAEARPTLRIRYEDLVAEPERVTASLERWVGWPVPISEPIVDGNAKWTSTGAPATRAERTRRAPR